MENEEIAQPLPSGAAGRRLSATALIISLSLAVFLLSCMAMYAAWLVGEGLGDFWRGLTSLGAWIVTFGAGALVFWRVIRQASHGVG